MAGIKKLSMTIVGATVFALGTSSAAQAAIFVSTSSEKVGIVDPSTGLFTPVASSPAFQDIAFSNEGTFFGITVSQLYRVDLSSGTSSLIGNLGISTLNALGFSPDNVLYGAGSDTGLYKINTLTGAASLVAYIPGFVSGGDIVFDPVNNRFLGAAIYGANTSLFSLETTGVAGKIGDIGFHIVGLAFDNGNLFGYTGSGDQIVIDPATGKGTFSKKVVDDSGSQVTTWGAASAPSAGNPTTSVPEPTSVFGSLLAFSAFIAKMRMKRKRQQKTLASTGS
ncbi:hypothetical protein QUA00_00555 [Microcoleus sp. T2B6]|uniref:hypothetical protein n=1 Tax=Microcoleus sp. T2B6 TaxID=3055424 RepID=UPI002FD72BF6